ncbi:hypothetical protein PR048_000445 [Dryococelus australis]|uniref:DDE Tnp4 domain-containing protein n=1 Tax=Dryococelus australis TaxID=614101 RepID=A0ABQ9IFZ0_9NEOP|nr:hypothetical protein PR048_000445 [Dryococelus australis]
MDDDFFVIAYAVSVLSLVFLAWKRQAKIARRRYWVHPVNTLSVVLEGEYFTLFKIIKEGSHDRFFEVWLWDYLLNLLKSHLTKHSFCQPISPEERLATTIRRGHSTDHKVIESTCEIIWRVMSERYVRIPDCDGWKKIADDFWHQRNFPKCFGAVDGKHVDIQAPKNSGSEYYNYKIRNSILLTAMCDARYRFTWALVNGDIELPPNRPLPNPNFSMLFWCVADQAFPSTENILRPYAGHNLPEEKRIFNYRLSRARRIIENTFGILTTRWRVFQARLQAEPCMVEKYIKAAACLHNFLIDTKPVSNTRYCLATYVSREENGITVPGEWRQPVGNATLIQRLGRIDTNNSNTGVIRMRDAVCNYFNSPEGELHWQYNAVTRG